MSTIVVKRKDATILKKQVKELEMHVLLIMIIQRPGGYTGKLLVISDRAELGIPTGRSMKRSHEAESILKMRDGESSDSDSEDLYRGSVQTSKGLLKGENKRF